MAWGLCAQSEEPTPFPQSAVLVHFVTCIHREHPSLHGAAVPHGDLLYFTLGRRRAVPLTGTILLHTGKGSPTVPEAVLHYTGGKSLSWPQPCTCLAHSTLVRENPACVLLEYGDWTFLWLGMQNCHPWVTLQRTSHYYGRSGEGAPNTERLPPLRDSIWVSQRYKPCPLKTVLLQPPCLTSSCRLLTSTRLSLP